MVDLLGFAMVITDLAMMGNISIHITLKGSVRSPFDVCQFLDAI